MSDQTGRLRDAAELMLPSVRATIAALNLDEADQGAVKLAERYAAAIDDAKEPAWAMRWLGPLLLDALDALGATPAARARLRKGETPERTGPATGGLARLRAARNA